MDIPDRVQRLFYDREFLIAFLTKKEQEFQTWFQALAAHAYGPDFEAVRAYGNQGDHNCDGRRISNGTIFQAYAPHHLVAAKLDAKIRDDFCGAVEHWPNMQNWVLVTNDERGLPPSTVKLLDDLRADNPTIDIKTWSKHELQRLTHEFSLADWRDVFGDVPSMADWSQMAAPHIKEILDDLEAREIEPGEEPLNPPSADKLERNSLSRDATTLLRAGREKERLVEQYLRRTPNVDLGERIAEAFRRRYAVLRDEGRSADEVFLALQEYAGGNEGPPTRQVAVLAVLSYYFERCDIFEDPVADQLSPADAECLRGASRAPEPA